MLNTVSMVNVNTPQRKRFTAFWKRGRSRKIQRSVLWCDLEIPAKLFYKISETANLYLLVIRGNPDNEQLEKAWFSIIDQVYNVRRDAKSQNIQTKEVHIALLNRKIHLIKAILRILYELILTKTQQGELIGHLKKFIPGVRIDQDMGEKEFKDAVQNILRREVKGLKAKLKIEKDRLKHMLKGFENMDKRRTYERVCLQIGRAIGLKLDISMTLAEFLAAEAEAIEINSRLRKKKNG